MAGSMWESSIRATRVHPTAASPFDAQEPAARARLDTKHLSVETEARASRAGEVMAWNDDLYEGPVPAGLSHEELSLRRAEFLISSGWREPRALPRL